MLSSEAALTLERDDGDRLELTRAITHDRDRVRIVRRAPGGPEFHLTLLTGPGAMTDAATGFQRFLFEVAWLAPT